MSVYVYVCVMCIKLLKLSDPILYSDKQYYTEDNNCFTLIRLGNDIILVIIMISNIQKYFLLSTEVYIEIQLCFYIKTKVTNIIYTFCMCFCLYTKNKQIAAPIGKDPSYL